MVLSNIDKFILKRVNAFPGLIIDDDIWRDSHDYHRTQQRLHNLAVHGPGIVTGLGVTANQPPGSSVIISPGMAIDSEGNIIVVSQPQIYKIQSREKGTIYINIQFREILTGPYQPPEDGQPTRILEAYSIQERPSLPDEPYLELARVDFDPSDPAISVASNPYQPGINQIDTRFRRQFAARVKRHLTFCHLSLEQDKEIHRSGLAHLVREINRITDFEVTIEMIDSLNDSIECNMLYMTGKSRFELDAKAKKNLASFIECDGIVFGEGCAQDPEGPKEYGLAFNRLARELGHRLEKTGQGHPLLTYYNIFAATPPGASTESFILASPRVIYSGSDYGCAWDGGHPDNPLPRDVIRGAFEMGMNICLWGH